VIFGSQNASERIWRMGSAKSRGHAKKANSVPSREQKMEELKQGSKGSKMEREGKGGGEKGKKRRKVEM